MTKEADERSGAAPDGTPPAGAGEDRDCTEARASIALFVTGELQRARGKRLRNHLGRCEACLDAYRSAMEAAARMGRDLREERDQSEREARREGQRQRALDATGDRRRPNRFGLRLALLPAVFGLLILLVRSSGAEEGLVAHWVGGEVHVGGQRMNEERAILRLSRGDWCTTSGNARVRLAPGQEPPADGDAVPFVLGLETAVFVVDPARRELRLEEGQLSFAGSCRVTTPWGILEADDAAEGTLESDARGARLTCAAGRLTWTGPLGRRSLGAGEAFDSAGSIASADRR